MKTLLILASVFTLLDSMIAQDPGMFLLKADRLYKDSNYLGAEEHYRNAHHLQPGFKTYYNLGNSLYQQGRAKEAIDFYQQGTQSENDPQRQAKAYYNLGNAYFQEKKFDQSIQAYQEALKRQPANQNARNNLLLAKQELQQQQQQQQQQEQQQKQANQPPPQPNEDQKSKNQAKPQPPQNQNKASEKAEDQMQRQEKLNKEQLEQLMRMIGDQDQKTREKMQKTQSRSPKRQKDW